MDSNSVIIAVDAVVFSLYAVGLSRLLPMRRPLVFIVLYAATPFFLEYVGYLFLNAFLAAAIYIAVTVLLPFMLYEGTRAMKAVAVVVGTVCSYVCQWISSFLIVVLTGHPVPEDYDAGVLFFASHVPQYVLSSATGMILFLVAASFLSSFLHKRVGLEYTRFVWFLVVLACLHGSLLLIATIAQAMTDSDMLFIGIVMLAGMACFVADVFVVYSMERYVAKIQKDEHAAMLQKQLDEYLVQYESVIEQIELAGRMRHDVRNQTQVVIDLSERGMIDRARAHLSSLEASLSMAMDEVSGKTAD